MHMHTAIHDKNCFQCTSLPPCATTPDTLGLRKEETFLSGKGILMRNSIRGHWRALKMTCVPRCGTACADGVYYATRCPSPYNHMGL